MRKFLMLLTILIPNLALAGGWSNWAIPTRIDIERGNGFMVYGNYGNPNGCTASDTFYVKKDHTQYKEIYSMILTAFSSGKKIQVYIHNCEAVVWYSEPAITYNVTIPDTAVNVSN